MSIRIFNDGLAGTAASEASRVHDLSRATSGGTPSSGPAAEEDQAQISSLAETLAAQSSHRAARVQELAAAYQSGRYQVNSTDVSRSIVNHALQAGGAESGQ